jgi:uncharacterized protein (AIM24 family)
VLTGELLKGQSIMQAANSLSKLFKIAPLQAQQMLARAPLVIKKNLEEDTALRFVQAMFKSGFGASIEEQKAVKTTILMHSFSSHYHDDEDDADEEPAAAPITPVLVEQSRLEESLDTELMIPVVPAAAASIAGANDKTQISVHGSIKAPAGINADVVDADEVNSGVKNDTSESHAIVEALTQSAEPVAQISMLVAEHNQQEEIAQASVDNLNVICAADVEDSELDTSKTAIGVAETDASDASSEAKIVETPIYLDVSLQDTAAEQTAQPVDSASELSEQNLEKSASKTSAEIPDISKPSSSNDLFATWDTDAAEEVAVDEVATDEVAEHEVVVNETSVNDTLVNETLVAEPVAQTPIADTSSNEILVQSTEAQVVDAISVEDSASSGKAAEDFDSATDAAASDATSASEETANNSIKTTFTPDEPVAERVEEGQQLVSELADASDTEPSDELEDTVDAVAELEDDLIATAQTAKNEVVEAEAEAVAEADLSELLWIEPVAQWQTVAELAEAGALEQPQAAVINSSALSHASTDAIVGFDSGAGDFSNHNVFNDKSVDATRFDDEPSEPPTTWDESVEITQALTDRLAQIAEESKEDVNHQDDVSDEISATSVELETDASTTPEGVLLFEEADVTEISAADWDDWHPVEPYSAESGKRVFNPLLDFDQVEADWKNSPVELSFDAAGPVYSSDHHCGLTAENEQELAAFLGAADTYEPEEKIGSGNYGSIDRLESTEEDVDESELTDEYLNARTADTVEASTLQATSYSSLDASEEFAAKESAIKATQGISKEVDAEGWAHEISVQANCGFLEVTIPKGKELHVAAAAAVTMGLSLHEQLQAGSGVRAWLLAKGFVINTYEAIESAGNVGITAITHGMVCAIDASDFPVMVQQNAYLASTDGVQLNADQSRLNPVVNGCKWIHCSGAGELWLNAQGLWEMVEVDGCYRINSRFLMAFSKSLELKAPPLAGLKSYLTSGGGVECRLTGRGVVWVQTDASRAPVLWQKAS